MIVTDTSLKKSISIKVIFCFITLFVLILSSCVSSNRVTSLEKGNRQREKTYSIIAKEIEKGNSEKALNEYKKLPAEQKKKIENRILYARLLISLNRIDEAEQVLSTLLKGRPENTEALYSLSMVYRYQGRIDNQKVLLERLLKINPAYSLAYISLGELYLYGGYSGYSAKTSIDKASVLFDKALKLDPANAAALSGKASVYKRERRYKEALSFYNRAIDADKKNPYNYIDRSSVRKMLNDTIGALKDLNTAAAIIPDYYWIYIDRGVLYLERGQDDLALNDFNEAIRIDPSNFTAFAYKGGILYNKTKKIDEAVKTYSRLVSLNPEYYFAYSPLGVLYYIKGKWKKSILFFKKAYKYEKKEFAYPLIITLAYRNAGEEDKSQIYLEREIVNFPRDSWYYDIAKFLLNPKRDIYIIKNIHEEKVRFLRERMLFYLASQFSIMKRNTAASTYFLEIADSKFDGKPEFKIARELIQIKKGGF